MFGRNKVKELEQRVCTNEKTIKELMLHMKSVEQSIDSLKFHMQVADEQFQNIKKLFDELHVSLEKENG